MLVPMHATLAQLIAQALHNSPDQRPTAEDLLIALQQMKEEVDGQYGGRAIKLDMEKVKLTKEVKMKDGRIQELEQQVHMHGIQGIFSILIHVFILQEIRMVEEIKVSVAISTTPSQWEHQCGL